MLRDWLIQHEPEVRWPAASSIGELLKRSNLIARKRRHNRDDERAALDTGRTRALEPNMVWGTADFKGEFRLKSGCGPYCYPLTVLDLHSRFLLNCTALETTAVAPTEQIFVRLFREYGLPSVLRTDNGVPFAQPNALGRLGRLAFWWVRLGIRPEHITPARPSENGAHERFHTTLKAAATKPASPSLRSQQRRFDDFRTEYNTHRPHSSLPDHRPPGQFYTNSPRAYNDDPVPATSPQPGIYTREPAPAARVGLVAKKPASMPAFLLRAQSDHGLGRFGFPLYSASGMGKHCWSPNVGGAGTGLAYAPDWKRSSP